MASIVVYSTDWNHTLQVIIQELNLRGHNVLDGYSAFIFKRDLTKSDQFVYVTSNNAFPGFRTSSIAEQLTNMAHLNTIPLAVIGSKVYGDVQFWCDDLAALLKIIDDRWPSSKEKRPVVED